MSFIKWTSKEKLGISSIDKQHKEIYDIVNALYEIRNGSKTKILKQFNILLLMFEEHFLTEEQFMEKHKVPSLFSHRLEHKRGLDKYTTYYENYKSNNEPFDEEIVYSLKTWLHNHAEMKDNKLKPYANK